MDGWVVELSEYGIQYKPRLGKKGQVMVDFLVEIPQTETCSDSLNWWILSVDGASQHTGADIGPQLKSSSKDKIEQAIRLSFSASNNELEYEAILVEI